MGAVFNHNCALLQFGVVRVNHAAKNVLIPLPIFGIWPELGSKEACAMNPDQAFALRDKFLQCRLLIGSHLEGSKLEHDKYLAVGKVFVCDHFGIAAELNAEVVIGCHLLKNRL